MFEGGWRRSAIDHGQALFDGGQALFQPFDGSHRIGFGKVREQLGAQAKALIGRGIELAQEFDLTACFGQQ
jgi:hypothetical protein